MDRVLAIVVSYNGMKWYSKCFQNLENSSIPIDIIAVDNASVDSSIDYIKKNFPKVLIIAQDSNKGFGKANNEGLKEALKQDADYVFLLNQDAWVEEDTIEKLIAVHKAQQDYGILSPMHLNGKGDELDGGFQNYISPIYTPNFVSDQCLDKLNDVYETRFVNAAAWLISRKCLETIGGFDPIFYHYGEDNNYCQRVRYHGLKVGIVPTVRIYHDRDYQQEEYGKEQILRHYLITIADIGNPNFRKENNRFIYQDRIRIITGVLRGDSNRIASNIKNLRIKRKYYPMALKSRNQNQKKGANYLS